MSAVKCSSSRSITISIAFNRRSTNVYSTYWDLLAYECFLFPPSLHLKTIDANFMLILLLRCVHISVFIVVLIPLMWHFALQTGLHKYWHYKPPKTLCGCRTPGCSRVSLSSFLYILISDLAAPMTFLLSLYLKFVPFSTFRRTRIAPCCQN